MSKQEKYNQEGLVKKAVTNMLRKALLPSENRMVDDDMPWCLGFWYQPPHPLLDESENE